MATLDDKLLGEKTHYYCSSSEDEDDSPSREEKMNEVDAAPPSSNAVMDDWQGYSTNTGPKGVINDFQRWKRLESEKRVENEVERLALANKLSFACQTEREQQESQDKHNSLDDDLDNLLDNTDDVMLQEFMKKRMEEMMNRTKAVKTFGNLVRCSHGSQFLNEIEKETPDIKVICALYSLQQKDGYQLSKIFEDLAKMHPSIKFISVEVSSAGMSTHFEEKGCPAILVYKQAALIGNFVRVTDSIGKNFVTEDVEGFLVDHGYLTDSKCIPDIVSSKFRNSASQEKDNSSDDDSI
jgi:hypothetical protein